MNSSLFLDTVKLMNTIYKKRVFSKEQVSTKVGFE